MENDDNIKMSVGIQNLISIDFELDHINYNCRGTVKGLVSFNYVHLPIKYVGVQLLKKEVVFSDNKNEPIIIEEFELIDGSLIKNDIVPFRIFLKAYNLTPTYKNIGNIFCVKYYINLIIGDFQNNTFFKQTEIKLFRVFKTKSNPELNYGPWEEFISEPIYNEEYYFETIEKKENKENKDKNKKKDLDLNNLFNDEDDEIEEEEDEEEEEESDEKDVNEEKVEDDNINDNNEFIISTSSEEAKKKEEKTKKKKKRRKYNIVSILRSNSLYKSDKKPIVNNKNNVINNNINNNGNSINIPFNDDNDEEDNNYMNQLITTNFPSNSYNNLFNDNTNINNINYKSKYGKI